IGSVAVVIFRSPQRRPPEGGRYKNQNKSQNKIRNKVKSARLGKSRRLLQIQKRIQKQFKGGLLLDPPPTKSKANSTTIQKQKSRRDACLPAGRPALLSPAALLFFFRFFIALMA